MSILKPLATTQKTKHDSNSSSQTELRNLALKHRLWKILRKLTSNQLRKRSVLTKIPCSTCSKIKSFALCYSLEQIINPRVPLSALSLLRNFSKKSTRPWKRASFSKWLSWVNQILILPTTKGSSETASWLRTQSRKWQQPVAVCSNLLSWAWAQVASNPVPEKMRLVILKPEKSTWAETYLAPHCKIHLSIRRATMKLTSFLIFKSTCRPR